MSEKTPLSRVWEALENFATQFVDWRDFHNKRAKHLEDRLAKIDGGSSSAEAKFAAYDAVNVDRRLASKDELGFKLK